MTINLGNKCLPFCMTQCGVLSLVIQPVGREVLEPLVTMDETWSLQNYTIMSSKCMGVGERFKATHYMFTWDPASLTSDDESRQASLALSQVNYLSN